MKKRLLITVLQLAVGGADFHFTNRNAHARYFMETDPIARPFVTHSTAERAAYFAAMAGGSIAAAELLEHLGYRKLGYAIRAIQIEENTRGALFSATH
jgi:hypothetical protein